MAISAKATTSYVGRVTRTLAGRIDPAATARRETKAKAGRMVKLEMGLDGMAWLTIHAPAALASAAYERVDGIAHSLPTDADPETGEVDARSMDAKRADVACDLLFGARIDPDGTVTGPAPVHVHVTVDSRGVSTAQGSSDGLPGTGEIGEIGRLGPVSSATIRDLLDLADRSAGIVDGAHATEQTVPRSRRPPDRGPRPLRAARAAQALPAGAAPGVRLPRLPARRAAVRARPHRAPPRRPDVPVQSGSLVRAPPPPQAPGAGLAPGQPRRRSTDLVHAHGPTHRGRPRGRRRRQTGGHRSSTAGRGPTLLTHPRPPTLARR